jgi:hypothetical protein
MMILNAYTIIFLFIAALTGLLAAPIGYLSLKTYFQTRKTVTEEERDFLVDSPICCSSLQQPSRCKLADCLYSISRSVIPQIYGAMCIFGATQAHRSWRAVLKPLVFFCIGGWLILRRLGQAHESSSLFRTQHLFLAAVSLLIILDSSMDILYFTSFDMGADVACCTTVFDLAEGKRAALTTLLIGKGYDRVLLPLYFFTNILMIAFLAVSSVRMTRESPARETTPRVLSHRD